MLRFITEVELGVINIEDKDSAGQELNVKHRAALEPLVFTLFRDVKSGAVPTQGGVLVFNQKPNPRSCKQVSQGVQLRDSSKESNW